MAASILCTPAQHRSGRAPWNFQVTLWCSWVIEEIPNGVEELQPADASSSSSECPKKNPCIGKKLVFAGDTAYCAVAQDEEPPHINSFVPPCPAFTICTALSTSHYYQLVVTLHDLSCLLCILRPKTLFSCTETSVVRKALECTMVHSEVALVRITKMSPSHRKGGRRPVRTRSDVGRRYWGLRYRRDSRSLIGSLQLLSYPIVGFRMP